MSFWAAAVAPKIFGTQYLVGNQFTIFPYSIILGVFYLASLYLFPRRSIIVFLCFVLSGILLILSQSAEWSFRPAMLIIFGAFDYFDKNTLMFAWEGGLEMVGYSLLSGGIIIGISRVQMWPTTN